MIIEQKILPFHEWIGPIFLQWLLAVAVLLATAVIVGLIISAMKFGIASAFQHCRAAIKRGREDFFLLSFRRTWAIARLTIKESFRRRVLFLCVVFLVILMLAGWYLDPNNPNPAKLYLSFVSTATCYLMLLLAMFLSAFSLPTDFKTKTIFTVVTKPVRASEMVLGRIVGITVVGTLILLFMSGLSYFFVQFSLGHAHLLIEREDLTEVSLPTGMTVDNASRVILNGETQQSNGHKHKVEVRANGSYFVNEVNGHTHQLVIERPDGKKNTDLEFDDNVPFPVESGAGNRYTVLEAEGAIQARVPIYGKLTFRGRDGMDTRAGINVGNEWEYRTFIGGTGGSIYSSENKNQEAAFWTFEGITKNRFPDGLPIEMTLGVYRTHKGDMERQISANIALRNPKTGLFVDVMTFRTEEFITKAVFVPESIEGSFSEINQRRVRDLDTGRAFNVPSDEDVVKNAPLAGKKVYNLFEDLTDNGRLEVWLSCGDSQQYIGVSQYDLYFRAADAFVPFNFVKGFFGIWQQMLLMICYGVALSTFLSGSVAMVSTMGVLIAGFFKSYLISIGFLVELGGGPFEALVRILTHQNLIEDLPSGFATSFVKAIDAVFGAFLSLIGQAIPPLSEFSLYDRALASGFNIPLNWMFQNGLMTFSYAIPLFIVGYLILSNREVAK
ncbi:MAG: ABC transporter permease [Planctomycetaceae bacterium]|nr:ABC transporter permease [Planctomycetaceae bacterium]